MSEIDHESFQELSSTFKQLFDESVPAEFQANIRQPWKNAKFVRAHFFWGARGSSKTSNMESTGEEYYDQGLNIWHLWGARSFENLFWPINMNCGMKWKHDMERMPGDMRKKLENRLHCKCNRAIPILIINPEYREWDMKTVQMFNGTYPYWTSHEEYSKAVEKGWISPEITREDRKLLYEGKLKKPEFLLEKNELIKIANVPIPTDKESMEQFKKAYLKAALDARRESRVIVFNPELCAGEDKFLILGAIFLMIPQMANEYFVEPSEVEVGKMRGLDHPVPKSQWSKKEKGWNKICVILSELRTIAPNNKYSPQKGSSNSKRPIVDLIPELRHVRVWLLGDLQNPDDLNSSVRPQANSVIIKRANRELLGEEWKNFFNTIAECRQKEFRKYNFDVDDPDKEKFVPPEILKHVNKKFPRIEQLPNNKGYVVWPNGEFLLETFDFPNFHHKREDQNFWEITGIKSWFNDKKMPRGKEKDGGKDGKIGSKSKKELTHFLCDYAADLFLKGDGTWDDIPKQVADNKEILKKEHNIPEELIDSVTRLGGKSLNNKVRGFEDIAKKLDKNKFDRNLNKNHKENDS